MQLPGRTCCAVSVPARTTGTVTNLIIERLPDWSFGAFLNETDSDCIAIGFTEDEARAAGQAELARRGMHNVVYGPLARPSND